MNEEKFKKGISDIAQIRMTNEESNLIWNKLESYTVSNPLKIKVKSPWYSGVVFYATTRIGGVALSVLFISIITINSVFFAKNSLPGDTLYPLKVDVIEPLEYSLAVDSVSKTNILLNNLDTRLKEVEALEANGKLTDSIQSDLEKRLKNNAKKIDETTKNKNNKLAKSSKIETQAESSSSFAMENPAPVTMMMASKSTDEGIDTSTSTTRTSLKKKENKSEKIIRSTKESVERIKKSKKSNKKLLEVAEESIRKAEDSLKNLERDNKSSDR